MRRVFARWLLVGVLLAPNAFASEQTDPSLWAEFMMWLEASVSVETTADEASFSTWLMSRLHIPGG